MPFTRRTCSKRITADTAEGMIPTCIGVTLRSNADGSKDEDCAGGDVNKNGDDAQRFFLM